MDSLHAIGFYVSATLSIGGAILVAFLPNRGHRGLAMAAAGLGLGGIDLSLSAGLAGLVVVVSFLGIAWLIAGSGYRSVESSAGPVWRQLGALGAGGLLAITAYAAFRGDFVHSTFYGGSFGTAALGRLLFMHDAPSTEAVGALALVALVGATAAWRVRERGR
jgi:NADH:ubiquinone oxidoreductase subunit 6 (subunit J)